MNKEQFSKGIEVVTTGFIRKGNKFLLARSNNSDIWVLPGGHIEVGEKILDACEREVEEEVGLRIEPIKIINFGEVVLKSSHFVYFVVLFEIGDEEKVKFQKGELEYSWFTLEEALKLNIAEIFRDTVESFKEYLN